MDTQHQQFRTTNEKAVKLGQNDYKEKNALLNGLSETVFTKVAHCKSAKDIWDKIQNIYEGDSKFKAAKIEVSLNNLR
jgi:alpha-acetolactate decarboxylase